MDVIVQWNNGEKNCVNIKELQCVRRSDRIKKGAKVKMLYENKWYFGTVVMTESDDTDSSSDDEPLAVLSLRIRKKVFNPISLLNLSLQAINLPSFDSTLTKTVALNYNNIEIFSRALQQKTASSDQTGQHCEVFGCYNEVFSSCFKCSILLCWDHFLIDTECCDGFIHHPNAVNNSHCIQTAFETETPDVNNILIDLETIPILPQPEDFEMEGEAREVDRRKHRRENKYKEAKRNRDLGKSYYSSHKKTFVKEKELGPRCNIDFCKRNKRFCHLFHDEIRKSILKDFYSLGNLNLQREFIARHVQTSTVTRGKKDSSRKKFTHSYHLTLQKEQLRVCLKTFLNTLSVSEKSVRTVLEKLSSSGVIEFDRRGGRQHSLKNKDLMMRQAVLDHIERFPRVESHYCRADSSREYLHPDLTLRKMYSMFIDEQSNPDKPSFSLYRKIFKELNLSFHRPKKDMCNLCNTYLKGSEEDKLKLKGQYESHIAEKQKVRDLKKECKLQATQNSEIVCLCFDLQQVIFLPISKVSAVFYKRRLSVYNFTIFDVSKKDCFCWTWHQGEGNRGSSEIATCVYKTLLKYDREGVQKVFLFADGCPGQNKNSIVATMLMFAIQHTLHIKEISLRFFAPFHGQNEGDSAHSTISFALSKSGDVFVPSQLIPIFRLARRAHPFNVYPLSYQDFFDFKKMSQDLRLLTIRKDDQTGSSLNWTEMAEMRVCKEHTNKFYFKTSHLESNYRSITLKRHTENLLSRTNLGSAYCGPVKLPSEKLRDILSLCSGDTPVVYLSEHRQFYESLL